MSYIWNKDGFSLEYSNPRMTAFPGREGNMKDIKDVMYFYYTLTVKINGEVVQVFDSYDEHKVEDVSLAIEELMNVDMNKSLLLYERKNEHNEHREFYNRVVLDSYYDLEYFFILERTQYQSRDTHKHKGISSLEEIPLTINDYYSIQIGEGASNKEGYSVKEDYGKIVYIKNIEEKELLELKQMTEDFVKYAINLNNEYDKNMLYECEKCEKEFPYLENREYEKLTEKITCPHCGHVEID